jgi:hypothetical protein
MRRTRDEMSVATASIEATKRTRHLMSTLAGLMTLQAVMGLAFSAQYRDVEWIRTTWYGNDWVTLVVAVPLLLIARARVIAGSARGLLLWLGVTAYAAYNYAFYLFGAALNAFFPLYVAAVVLAAVALIIAVPRVDAGEIAGCIRPPFPAKVLGGYFVLVGIGLTAVWLAMWAAYAFVERPTPVEPDAFRLVAALDLSMMVPLLVSAGTLLWRNHAWGPVVGAMGGVQASLYLLVLSVNAIIAIQRELATSPGELPLWGTLFVVTTVASGVLILSIGDSRRTAVIGARAS